MTELMEYLAKEPAKIIYEQENIHPVLTRRPVSLKVTYSEEMELTTRKIKAYLCLWKDSQFICNSIKTTYPLGDLPTLGQMMVQEYLGYCQMDELDRELDGKCACQKYEDIYKSCDECPDCCINGGECLGATYVAPMHINAWKLDDYIKEKYGPGSETFISHRTNRCRHLVRELLDIFDDCPKLKKITLKALFLNKRM